jgi:hypothetical protein
MPKTIKMTRDFPVAHPSPHVSTWHEGTIHHRIPDDLADDLIWSAKAAIEVKVLSLEEIDHLRAEAKAEAAAEAEAARREDDRAKAEAATIVDQTASRKK